MKITYEGHNKNGWWFRKTTTIDSREKLGIVIKKIREDYGADLQYRKLKKEGKLI